MKPLIFILFLFQSFFITQQTLANTTVLIQSADDLIDTEYKKIKELHGDLNKDGHDDLIAVYENSQGNRRLNIAFKKGTSYQVVTSSTTALLDKFGGGMMGDPLQSIKVDRGSLVISHFGGSRQRWWYVYRFRYQKNKKGIQGFYLIGNTSGVEDSIKIENYKETDKNLLTGDVVVQTKNSKGEFIKTKKKEPVLPLIPINSSQLYK